MSEPIERFPLFPLGIVLLPGEIVPLHIFEPRYRTMIGECLESDAEFGIVWLGEGGLREVGCAARVTEVLERMEDGRLNILCQGTGPFRLLERLEELEYPAGRIQPLEDAAERPDPAAADRARSGYADVVERITDTRPAPDQLDELSSYAMAATIEFALDAKQALLEERSENARLEQMGELFEQTLKRMDVSEAAAEQAQGNGKVRFG